MKTFKEILLDNWRKSPQFKPEFEADVISGMEGKSGQLLTDSADEYKDQFCSCNQPAVADPSQLSLPLEHHSV